MRLLSIDPAGKTNVAGRGYAVIEYWYGTTMSVQITPYLRGTFAGGLPDERALQWGPLDLIVVEGQWANPEASRQSLLTLGFGAGLLAGLAAGCLGVKVLPAIVVPVYDWKNAIIPGFANAPKAMYTKNLKQMWPQVTNGHCLDAVGLGMAVARGCFPEKQLKKWTFK